MNTVNTRVSLVDQGEELPAIRVKVHPHYARARAGHPQALSVKVEGEPMYYYHAVLLENVSLVVHPSGRNRTLEEGRRCVHAWAVGDWVEGQFDRVPEDFADRLVSSGWYKGTYNPFYGPDFKAWLPGPEANPQPVRGASAAFLWGFHLYLKDPLWK